MINRERLIKTLFDLVKIDSPSGEEAQVANYLFDRLSKLGLKCQMDSYGNLVAKILGDNPIILTAHMDTVEPGRGIKPIIVDGIIKSSGDTILGADNKVAVATIVEAAESLVEDGMNPGLELVFTRSEETGNYGAINLDLSLIESREGYSFDAGGELGTVVLAAPFYNRFDIEILGKASHAAHSEEGINAIKIAAEAINNLPMGKLEKGTIRNIGLIEGGQVRNSVPGKVTVKGEVRSFTQEELDKATNRVVEEFNSVAAKYGATIKSEVVKENGGFVLEKTNKMVERAVLAMAKLEIKPIYNEGYACFDANIFQERGIDIVNLGDGTVANHTTWESVSVENLEKLAKIIRSIVETKTI